MSHVPSYVLVLVPGPVPSVLHMRFNWNKPNRKRRSAAAKGVLFVINCALCTVCWQLAVGTSQLAVPSCHCHSVYSYSLKAANGDAMRRRWGSVGYENGELQRKLVNVRLLSKAEAQLVQFSHGSSDSDVKCDAGSKILHRIFARQQ